MKRRISALVLAIALAFAGANVAPDRGDACVPYDPGMSFC